MKRLIALTIKEFRQLSRDHLTLRMIVMVPLMQMTIFGYAINFDVKHLPMVVLDESRSYESRELVAKMAGEPVLRPDRRRRLVRRAAQRRSTRRRASVGARHRRAISARIAVATQPAHALLIVNASDSTTSTQAMSIAAGIANSASMQQLAVQARWRQRELPVDLRVRPWYNPDLRTANFIIPGLLAIILTFTLISFTAASASSASASWARSSSCR